VQSSGGEIDELFGKLKNKSKAVKEPIADGLAEAAPVKVSPEWMGARLLGHA
jgi:hypothetical protein